MLDVAEIALLGGHLALDFVNTIEDRASRVPDDVLRTPADLDRWAQRVGAGTPTSQRPSCRAGELALSLEFRESLHSVLKGLTSGRKAPAAALGLVTRTIAEAHGARRLAQGRDGLEWVWRRRSPATIRYDVALAAEPLLTDPALLRRTSLCAAELCGWFYLDHSKNHSRRWCSMRGCGTQEKARRRSERG